MKMMCMIILLLILPVYFALKINKKISDVKNHISTCIENVKFRAVNMFFLPRTSSIYCMEL